MNARQSGRGFKPASRLFAGDISSEKTIASDRDLFVRELDEFLPGEIFDAHAHCYRLADCLPEGPLREEAGPEYGIGKAFERMAGWMGRRAPKQGLFFPFPVAGLNQRSANDFLAHELKKHPDSRGLLMATPGGGIEGVKPWLEEDGIVGFKTYHVFAGSDSFLRPVGDWTPEWVWEIAGERRWVILLHLVLPEALREPTNQKYLIDHCESYPGANVVLAHAGRGFNPRHTLAGLEALRGLPNVYFDTSAVAESEAFSAILDVFGPGRLLYGSDFPVSEMRGKSLALGGGFYWLYEQQVDPEWQHGKAVPTGLESLLGLRDACRRMSLDDRDVRRIFRENAVELLGLQRTNFWPEVQDQYRKARALIPGGTQLFSKRPELFAPDQWPAYYEEARGCEILDTQGRRFVDMSSGGILACLLGYADPDVNRAVLRRVRMGNMSTLQSYDEVELAEELLAIHPWAQQARFTRGGGDAMAVAVRIARAATDRSKVAVCGYHGWHDWYLAANLGAGGEGKALDGHLLPGLNPAGVPKELQGTALSFSYNRLEQLEKIVEEHGEELAAIVMESTRSEDPSPDFLTGARRLADQCGAVLVFDEISIGWRLCQGGAHILYGVAPDMAVFAKGISNGYAMGAVIGRTRVMEACQQSFISSSYWTEGIGPTAALATVRKLKKLDLPAHLRRIGQLMAKGWTSLGQSHSLPSIVEGRPEMLRLGFNHPEANAMMTFVTASMLKKGYLFASGFNAMLAHKERHVEGCLLRLDEVFGELADALAAECLRAAIGGPEKQAGFKRLAG